MKILKYVKLLFEVMSVIIPFIEKTSVNHPSATDSVPTSNTNE